MKMLGWMNHKLETRLLGEISVTSDTQMTPPLWQSLLMKVKEESESWLKTQHKKKKNEILVFSPITSW